MLMMRVRISPLALGLSTVVKRCKSPVNRCAPRECRPNGRALLGVRCTCTPKVRIVLTGKTLFIVRSRRRTLSIWENLRDYDPIVRPVCHIHCLVYGQTMPTYMHHSCVI